MGSDSLIDEVLTLSRQLEDLNRQERMGLLNYSDLSIHRNRITNAAMGVARNLQATEHPLTDSLASPRSSTESQNGLRLFISYAREDVDYVKNFEKFIQPLVNQGLLETWNDSKIEPGQMWEREIEHNLCTSDIILFMVSADFLASDYIRRKERKWAAEAVEQRAAKIVPVLVRECLWEYESFGKYQAVPNDESGELLPIANWADPNRAYTTVVKELYTIIKSKAASDN